MENQTQINTKPLLQKNKTLLSQNHSIIEENNQIDPNKLTSIKMIRNKHPIISSSKQNLNTHQISLRPRLVQQNQNQNSQNQFQNQNFQSQSQIKENQQQQSIVKKNLKTGDMPVVTTTDILENKKRLSLQNLLELTKSSEINQIKKINLKNSNLFVFEPDFPLTNIQTLILTHNSLINLMGLANLKTLKELDIDFNFIQDLSPLQGLESLQKLKANNNKISQIKSLEKVKSLQHVQLARNNIQDFELAIEQLQELPVLTELVFEENPATKSRFSYKFDVLWALKLVKLDNEVVTQKEYELSQAFHCSKEKPQTSNNEIFGDDSLNTTASMPSTRPITSHGKYEKKQYNQNEQSLKQREFAKRIQEMEESIQKYKSQLDQALQQKEQLEDYNESLVEDIYELEANIQHQQKENEELQFENFFTVDLQKENLDLRRKVAAYEQTLMFKDCDSGELKQQVYFLNKRMEDLEHENRQMKQKLSQYEN